MDSVTTTTVRSIMRVANFTEAEEEVLCGICEQKMIDMETFVDLSAAELQSMDIPLGAAIRMKKAFSVAAARGSASPRTPSSSSVFSSGTSTPQSGSRATTPQRTPLRSREENLVVDQGTESELTATALYDTLFEALGSRFSDDPSRDGKLKQDIVKIGVAELIKVFSMIYALSW